MFYLAVYSNEIYTQVLVIYMEKKTTELDYCAEDQVTVHI